MGFYIERNFSVFKSTVWEFTYCREKLVLGGLGGVKLVSNFKFVNSGGICTCVQFRWNL